jgi:hypothetical protein
MNFGGLFSPKETLVNATWAFEFGQERTPGNEAIIRYQVKNLIIQIYAAEKVRGTYPCKTTMGIK